MRKVAVLSLGCDKNRVDTEGMLSYLIKDGYIITDNYEQAEVIIVNTCAFIESARAESIETILAAAEFKKTGACKKLIVTGCLPQKYADELVPDLPEVDKFIGIDNYNSISMLIESLYTGESITQSTDADVLHRVISTPPHYAYLKIADGCDNYCTFCTIPSIRGRYRSADFDSLLDQAKSLVTRGVKELILVAQDVTRYGSDKGQNLLVPLLKELSTLDLKWIRLMYCYPECVTDELIEEITSNPKIVKYIDVPIQHIDNGILKLMNRRGSSEEIKKLFTKLKQRGIAVRTTLMTGFPSESEEQFKALCDFLTQYAPYNVGVFAYSPEDTPSNKIKGQIGDDIKAERVEILGEIHLNNARKANSELVGKTLKVIYEDIDYDRNMFKGRTEFNAPDIDTFVYFKGNFADVGEMYDVKITDYDDYDLIGEMI